MYKPPNSVHCFPCLPCVCLPSNPIFYTVPVRKYTGMEQTRGDPWCQLGFQFLTSPSCTPGWL